MAGQSDFEHDSDSSHGETEEVSDDASEEESPEPSTQPESEGDSETSADTCNSGDLVQQKDERERPRKLQKSLSQQSENYSKNASAVRTGVGLCLKRDALIPVLTVSQAAVVLKQPFRCPCPHLRTELSDVLFRRKTLGVRVGRSRGMLRPTGRPLPLPMPKLPEPELPPPVLPEEKPPPVKEPPAEDFSNVEPLVLWNPPEGADDAESIVVDPRLTKYLREHQREGVQFMFECVGGLREFEGNGCILADDMGLGKTLQSITLLWTCLRQGFKRGEPLARRAIVVCPTSLVNNWAAELQKWLKGSVEPIALCEASRDKVIAEITQFLSPHCRKPVLILSYEAFRIHAARFKEEGSCDLLICDEAHRLKNNKTITNQALDGLPCARRVLLSGTPIQNDLEEFFAMVEFTNPGILGGASNFRRRYQSPILIGREPDATEKERALCAERTQELSSLVNQFILRRTNTLLSEHLPPKVIQIVCCRLTGLQERLYHHFANSQAVSALVNETKGRARVLASITMLKKLCNHPKLIYEGNSAEGGGFQGSVELLPPEFLARLKGGAASRAYRASGALSNSMIEYSGKLQVLSQLLHVLRTETKDRIVLISNYTQTLDLFSALCQERRYPYLRLDGSTSITKRMKLVNKFNEPHADNFAFLLSSKAGGCGLNLVGANRLVLFDPDWNPATDKQAAARVWRDGQKKKVYVYRFLATGTIEEKVYQRQLSKEGLKSVVATEDKSFFTNLSSEDLRDLFTLKTHVLSDTHATLECERCPWYVDGDVEPECDNEANCAANCRDDDDDAFVVHDGGSDASEGSEDGDANTDGELDSAEEYFQTSGSETESRRAKRTKPSRPRTPGKSNSAKTSGEGKAIECDQEPCGDSKSPGTGKKRKGCPLPSPEEQIGEPTEEDLLHWGHHNSMSTIPDPVMQKIDSENVSFVFSCSVAGKKVESS